MKWITHQAVAVGVAYGLQMPYAALPAVFFGSILPDVLDQYMAGFFLDRGKAFNRIHRGTTHWFGWWLACLAACLVLPDPAATIALGLGFGALAHVLLDCCTVSGVPLFPWGGKARMSLKLCKTGSPTEYALLVLFGGLFWFWQKEPLLNLLRQARSMY